MIDSRLLSRVWDHLKMRDAKPRPVSEGRPVLQLVQVEDGPHELMIGNEIGIWGITAQDVADELAGVSGDLHVRLNSPGGDVFDGFAIYNMLSQHDGTVTVTVDGLAASAASFVAMAGDTVRMGAASQLMIHDAHGLCVGNAADMVDFADLLSKTSDVVAGIYASRGGDDAAQWRALMQNETWFSPQEAVDAGLADEVMPARRRRRDDEGDESGDEPVAARWNLDVFQFAGRRHAPAPAAARPAASVDVVATAVGPHETSVKEGEWDGPANEKRLPSPMPVATARKVYSWYDESRVEDGQVPKAACKLPHHFVNADGTPGAASLNGVRNALARLPQTEGLSDAERDTIGRHLRGHLPSDDDQDDQVDVPDQRQPQDQDRTVGRHALADDEPDESGSLDPDEPDPPTPASDPASGPEAVAESWESLTAGLLDTIEPSTVDDLLNNLLMEGASA